MKKIYLIIAFFLLISCRSNDVLTTKIINIPCPSILFASDHNVYIGNLSDTITLENISYQAEINNALFTRKCMIKNNNFFSTLSILFIVNPIDSDQESITLPFYIASIDKKKNIQDIQYFTYKDNMKRNIETKKLMETDMVNRISLSLDSVDQDSIIILGFLLDKKRLEILN